MRKLQLLSLVSTQPARRAAGIAAAVLLGYVGLPGTAHAKPFEDYIKPMPIVAPLSSASWGTAALPRDLSNGIESALGAGVHPEYYYWDGQIIRAKDGKYHMFMSTFSGNTNFGTSWQGSDAYHAISETNVLGPYVRKDYVYTNNGSHKGHNVSAVELPDGTYAVVVSETVPFTIYKSSSLDGPWTGCQPQTDIGASNISMFPRHDGKFQITERNGTIAIADTLCGRYVKQKPITSYTQNATDSVYPKRTSIPGVSNPAYTWQEDPHIWRSGGTYHIIYSGSGDRVGWHVYSPDGISWKDNGYAWSPRDYQKIFCYEGTTTCNAWYKMERPGVVLQDGHPTHITWAVADVDKDNQVTPGTNHGTKVIVVPFDGVAFDNDFGTGGGGTGGSGGSTGAGGASGTGGRDGGQGDSGSADATSTGGRSGTDGGPGGSSAGGATGGLGGNGASGGMGSGGRSGAGGTTDVAAGGASGVGGVAAAGGSGAGGTTKGNTETSGSGGRGAGGQTGGNGGAGNGGGGQAGSGSGGSTSPSTTQASEANGCSCAVQGRAQASGGAFVLGFVVLALLRRRRRSTKTS